MKTNYVAINAIIDAAKTDTVMINLGRVDVYIEDMDALVKLYAKRGWKLGFISDEMWFMKIKRGNND
jgi:hypothetical protein